MPVALSPGPWIRSAVIRRGNGGEDGFAVRRQLLVLVDDVPPASDIEHNATAVRVNRVDGRHSTAGAGTPAGANAASKRSSSCGRALALT